MLLQYTIYFQCSKVCLPKYRSIYEHAKHVFTCVLLNTWSLSTTSQTSNLPIPFWNFSNLFLFLNNTGYASIAENMLPDVTELLLSLNLYRRASQVQSLPKSLTSVRKIAGASLQMTSQSQMTPHTVRSREMLMTQLLLPSSLLLLPTVRVKASAAMSMTSLPQITPQVVRQSEMVLPQILAPTSPPLVPALTAKVSAAILAMMLASILTLTPSPVSLIVTSPPIISRLMPSPPLLLPTINYLQHQHI